MSHTRLSHTLKTINKDKICEMSKVSEEQNLPIFWHLSFLSGRWKTNLMKNKSVIHSNCFQSFFLHMNFYSARWEISSILAFAVTLIWATSRASQLVRVIRSVQITHSCTVLADTSLTRCARYVSGRVIANPNRDDDVTSRASSPPPGIGGKPFIWPSSSLLSFCHSDTLSFSLLLLQFYWIQRGLFTGNSSGGGNLLWFYLHIWFIYMHSVTQSICPYWD